MHPPDIAVVDKPPDATPWPRQVDASLASEDTEECAAWKRILEAVAELSRLPNEGERLN